MTSRFAKTPLLLAIMIISSGQVGVSIYLPSLPMVSSEFGIAQAQVQNLVTFYLLAFGLSQLFYGPLSDTIGRRPVFLLGQGVYLIGTLVCVFLSHHFDALQTGRILQGLGAGSASVLSRAVLRDCYEGPSLTKALSYLAIMASILPIASPVIGGWISFHLGWRAVFFFVLFFLAAIFVLGFLVLRETLPYDKSRFRLMPVLKNYGPLLLNTQVLSSASYNWLAYLASIVTVSILPFLMQEKIGMTSAHYGSLMIIPSLGLLSGSLGLNLLRHFFSISTLLIGAIIVIALSGIWLMATPLSAFNLIWGFSWLCVAQGFSFPISMTLLLTPHKQQAGAVSALSGAVQMCIAGFLGALVVEFWVNGQQSLGAFYVFVAVCMLSVAVANIRHRSAVTA